MAGAFNFSCSVKRGETASEGGFTLVELLVVISIISLLIALLLPSLQSARETARAIRCLANLRQSHMGVHMYRDDWKGVYPTAGEAAAPFKTVTWSGAVAHYLSVNYITDFNVNHYAYPEIPWSNYSEERNHLKPHILKCPSESFIVPSWKTKVAVSYGWNTAPYGMGRHARRHYVKLYPTLPIYYDYYARVSEVQIRQPSKLLMVGEHLPAASGWYEYANSQFETPNTLATYHNGGGNVLWNDGHATREKTTSLEQQDFRRK